MSCKRDIDNIKDRKSQQSTKQLWQQIEHKIDDGFSIINYWWKEFALKYISAMINAFQERTHTRE